MNFRAANRRGYTLLEILATIVITSVLSLVIAQISHDFVKDVQRNKIHSTRDQLAALIRQSAGDLKNLKWTLSKPENNQFRDCVCGTGSSCTSATVYPLVLYEKGSGEVPLPLYYDASGVPCDKTVKNCLIEITTTFVSQCFPKLPDADPLPPFVCGGTPVEFVAVLYNVHQNPLNPLQGEILKPLIGAAYVEVENLAPPGSGVCP